MAKRITRAFIVVNCLSSFSIGWVMSTYVLFLVDKDLSLFQANLLNVSFMLGNFFMDPPTGYLADKIGQRRIYILGQIAWGAAHLIYGTGTTFGQFIMAELTAALGHSLMSGALDSWLRNNTDAQTTSGALSKTGSYSRLAGIPSALLGSVIASQFGLTWPWLIAAISAAITVSISVWLLAKLPEKIEVGHELQLLPSFWSIVQSSWKNPTLRFSMFVAFVSMFAFQPFNMFWSVIMKDASGKIWWLGTLWAAIAVFVAFGAYLSGKKFLIRLNGRGLALVLASIGLPILLTSTTSNVYILVSLFLLHEIGRGALDPLLFTYANRHIPNLTRSTANSIRSSAGTLGSAAGLIASGLLSEFISPLAIWAIFAGVLILFAVNTWLREK